MSHKTEQNKVLKVRLENIECQNSEPEPEYSEYICLEYIPLNINLVLMDSSKQGLYSKVYIQGIYNKREKASSN